MEETDQTRQLEQRNERLEDNIQMLETEIELRAKYPEIFRRSTIRLLFDILQTADETERTVEEVIERRMNQYSK